MISFKVKFTSSQINREEVHFFDFLQVAVDHLKMLIVAPLVVAIIITVFVYLIVPEKYTATVRFIAPQPPQSMGAGALNALGLQGLGGAGIGFNVRNPVDLYISFMTSNRLRDAIIERYGFNTRYKKMLKEDIREEIASASNVVAEKSGMIIVKFTDIDPKIAASAANSYPEILQSMITEYSIKEATIRHEYYSKQLVDLREKVKRQEAELKRTGFTSDLLKLDIGSTGSEIASLKNAITSQEIRLRTLSTYLSSQSPEYRHAQNELNSLKIQLQKTENKNYENDNDKNNSKNYPEEYRNYRYNLQLLENLVKQAELASIDSKKDNSIVQVVDVAEIPEIKSSPSLLFTMIISTILTGIFLFINLYFQFGFKRALAHHPELRDKFSGLAQSWNKTWRWRS